MALSRAINSLLCADDERAGNQSEIIAVTLPYINLSDRSARFFEFLQSGCQPYARTDHNQRPAVKPRYCCNGRLPDGYHHDQSGKAPRSLICCNATAS